MVDRWVCSGAVVCFAVVWVSGCSSVTNMAFDGTDGWVWKKEAAVKPGQTWVRFAVVGDAGLRNAEDPRALHYNGALVARAVEQACAEGSRDCEFSVFVGDNVYPRGLQPGNLDDEAFFQTFIETYAPIGPQYYTLGNHDWGTMINYSTEVARNQLAAIRADPRGKARGGAHFYNFEAGPVSFWAWDTTYLTVECGGEPLECGDPSIFKKLEESRPTSVLGWTMAFGHHPYMSNGMHGNAGDYYNPLYEGEGLKALMDQYVVGQIDLYMSGHDHDMQFLAQADGQNTHLGKTGLLLSGAGSKCRSPGDQENASLYYAAGALGFAIVDVDAQQLEVTTYRVSPLNAGWEVAFVASRAKNQTEWSYETPKGTFKSIDMSGIAKPDDLAGCVE